MKRVQNALWEKAFTLVEMLAAIAITTVLIALLFSALSKALIRSKSSQCVSNLKQIYMASMAWSSDNNGRIVPVFYPADPNNATSLQNWTGLLSPYLGGKKSGDFTTASELPVCACPLCPKKFGYGYNYRYLSWPQGEKNIYKWVQLAGVARLSQTVLIVDSKDANDSKDFKSWRAYVRPPETASWLSDYIPAFDHEKKANVLWLDGHVTSEGTNAPFWKDDQLWSGL